MRRPRTKVKIYISHIESLEETMELIEELKKKHHHTEFSVVVDKPRS